MRHLRIDYDRIQDPAVEHPHSIKTRPIGEDEPVFLLRGRDMLAPRVVLEWAQAAQEAGADLELVHAVRAWAAEMRRWGEEHGTKLPDTPHEYLRTP